MKLHLVIARIVPLLLLLAACSSGVGGPGGPKPPPPGSAGRLIAYGTSYIHTFDLRAGEEWTERLSYSAPWSTVTVAPATHEVLIANTSGSEPVTIEVFDSTTFGLDEAFEWPNSTSISDVYVLAATHDGRYLALVMDEIMSDPFLEILDRQTGTIVYLGASLVAGSKMAWTADDELVMAADLAYLGDPETWGALVSFPLQTFLDSTNGDISGTVLTYFTRAEWGDGVSGLALSPDASELDFQRGSDLWVMDAQPGAEPHQLTTGPSSLHNAVFSPDGQFLAVAAGGTYGLDETYIIPNHRQAPIYLEHGQGGDEYLLEPNTLVDGMLLWQP